MAEAIFDTPSLIVDERGVRDFYWPVSRREVLSVRNVFIERSWSFFKSEFSRNNNARLFAALIGIIPDVVAAYQMQALLRRSRRAEREPIVSRKSAIASAVKKGWVPEASQNYSLLSTGFRRAPIWKVVLREARDRARGKVIKQKIPALVRWRNQTVTVATGPMIQLHAEDMGQVDYVALAHWFHPLNSGDRKTFTGGVSQAIVNTLVDMAREAFAAGNEPLAEPSAKYLHASFKETAEIADRHLGRILAHPSCIPHQLWRGTGGLIFSRLLSLASQEIGGHVTGHDHSHGQGLWSSFHDTLVELPFANRFMVWTTRQCEFAKRNFRADLYPSDSPPLIEALGRPAMTFHSHRERKHSLSSTYVIMYVGTIYADDMVHFTPITPGPVLLDWEMRLISHLLQWGYEVLVQPHPENVHKITKPFEQLGARVLSDRFENSIAQADVLLFAQPQTSTFLHALGTDIPIVLPSLPLNPWQPEVLELIRRRCALAETWLDEDNRLQTDWDQLKRALELAPNLNSRALSENLFGIR